MILLVFCFCIFCFSPVSADRQVSVDENPGWDIEPCDRKNSSVTLIYIRSQGDEDCVHFLWFLENKNKNGTPPTLLVLSSNNTSSHVKIDCPKFLSPGLSSILGSIKLVYSANQTNNISTTESAVYVLNDVLEYNDTKDTANPTTPGNFNVTLESLRRLRWNISTNGDVVWMKGTANTTKLFTNASQLTLKFETYRRKGRQTHFPHLFYNQYSSSLELEAKNLKTAYSGSRIAVSVLVSNAGNAYYGGGCVNGSVEKSLKWTIDDEYSPSVFTIDQLLWKERPGHPVTNFWQWRTVCYTSPSLTREGSTDVRSTPLSVANSTTSRELLTNRLLLAYFGKSHIVDMVVKQTLVSFGKEDDGFYRQTKYVSWTSLVGVGEPPSDHFSLAVICIILAGVGCPVLVILAGGVFMVCKKCTEMRRRRSMLRKNYKEIR